MSELEMMEVTTESGEKIKVVKADSVEIFKKETEEKLKLKDEELVKERAKEKNFRALRTKKLAELSEEEKKAINEKEQMLMERQEEMEEKMNNFQQGQVKSWKDNALASLGIDDDSERTKVLGNFDRLKDPEDSAQAIEQKMRMAYSITFQRAPNIGERSVRDAVPFGGGSNGRRPETNYGDTDAGKSLAGKLGMKFIKEVKK